MVGDRWRDVEAGRRAGCRTVFIDYGYAEAKPDATSRHDRPLASRRRRPGSWSSPPEHPRRRNACRAPDALRIKLFADGADKAGMLDMYRNPLHHRDSRPIRR